MSLNATCFITCVLDLVLNLLVFLLAPFLFLAEHIGSMPGLSGQWNAPPPPAWRQLTFGHAWPCLMIALGPLAFHAYRLPQPLRPPWAFELFIQFSRGGCTHTHSPAICAAYRTSTKPTRKICAPASLSVWCVMGAVTMTPVNLEIRCLRTL